MKKIVKIFAGLTALSLIGVLLWTANGFLGNPISKSMANKSAEKFIKENYQDLNLEVEEAEFSFKDGKYLVDVSSPSSMDTYFTVIVLPNVQVFRTTYEDQFLSKFNTWQRVNEEYRLMVHGVLQDENFPYESDIDFGEIPIINPDDETFGPKYGVVLEDLEIDERFDLTVMVSEIGHIVFYTSDDEITPKRAAEILLDLKNIFDENQVPFYAIDFTLQEPESDSLDLLTRKTFSVGNFLYEDIHEENLEQRLDEAAKELTIFYNTMDSKK